MLTPRQFEICGLIALGWTNKQIACELGITGGTVGVLLSQAFSRSGAENRAAIGGRYARELALKLYPAT